MRSILSKASQYPVLGLLPFFAYMGLFFFAPAVGVLIDAFKSNSGHFTLSNLHEATTGAYFHSFIASAKLSTISALIAAIIGLVLVVAIVSSPNRMLRRAVTAASGVLANTGGIPLAFAFIATLGNFGVVTKLLASMGYDPYSHGFTLYSLTGLIIVYQYFLIPLMVLVMLPAVEGLRREWSDAAANLGAKRRQFWLHVGLPLLMPPFLAGLLILFTDAFAAYATAAAISGGIIPLVPLQIGNLISGNVVANQAHLGDALGLEMVLLVVVVALVYAFTQRKTSRWLH
ncbi:MAG: ABC transporter permease [Acidimicrobiales bacterium]